MSNSASYNNDLVLAYDADGKRRAATIPSKWRTDIIDAFADKISAAGVESVLELGCGTGQLARYLAISTSMSQRLISRLPISRRHRHGEYIPS